MSSHSRSSSELDTIPYADVLPVFVKDFLKDFCFADVQYYVKDLFTTEEYTAIVQQKNEKWQILQLFWVLCGRESIIPKFLDIIRDSYDWLVDKVVTERNNLSKDTELYIETLKELRSRNQQHTDFNVHRIQYFNQLRNALRELKPYHYVVLYGDLGKGKRWLALDVCSEYTVMRKMNYKIYWIDVSECTSQEHDLRHLQHFRLLLGDSNCATLSSTTSSTISISNRILDLQQDLKLKLHSDNFKNCLLVLLNVQNVKTWRAFNLGCKMLLTTRNKKVSESLSDKMSRVISIDKGLTLNEFQTLFEKYLSVKRYQFPPNANDIYDYSTGNPYLLSIIAKNIRRKKYDWNQWIGQLKNLEITDNKFNRVIEISLNVLTTDLLELYATFAIFPHSIVIPVKLLASLWNKLEHEAEIIVQKFHKYSIVNKTLLEDTTVQVCSLPFIYSTYLKTASKIQGNINTMELHRKVIDYYNIEKTFQTRTEIDLCTSQHDLYFFSYIGYHLQEAGCTQLFQQLYLDFGFLGQKIRAVGLLSTLGDLKYYEKEITDLDPRIKELLYSIRKFLPQIEEKLLHTKDTCLLQYALMATGEVQIEAKKQIKRFPDKVWFYENGSFHQRRQIVNLPGQPKVVNFLMQDNCLIVLDNNNMLLVDISLDCNQTPVLLINDELQKDIIQTELFRHGDFMLTLNEQGELKLWFIGDMRRRKQTNGSTSHKFQVNPLSFNWNVKMVTRKSQQSIHEYNMKRGKIVAFHIEQEPARYGNSTLLHIAYDTGDICALKWNAESQEFQSEMHLIPLRTGECSIRFLSKIHSKFYMVLNRAGNISFWNLRDTSKMPLSFEWPEVHSTLLTCEVYEDPSTLKTCIIYVFTDRIFTLTVAEKSEPVLQGHLQILYVSSGITCAKLSQDKLYLVIGTKMGLCVYDMKARSEVLRGNVSEAISCVDIFDLDDPVYKYVIICGCRSKNVLNILALLKTERGSIVWSHNVGSQMCSEQSCNEPQLEPDVWLVGHKLYDMYTDNEDTWLLAADSKNRIHHVNTNTKKWLIMPTDTSQCITAITVNRHNAFAGYKNGAIINLSQERLETPFTDSPIAYLQLVDDRFLVASTKASAASAGAASHQSTALTHVSDLLNKAEKTYKIDTKVCFRLNENYILLINENGYVLLHDIRDHFEFLDDLKNYEMGTVYLGGCDFKNSFLFLATTKYNIYGYHFKQIKGELKKEFRVFKNNVVQSTVTCLTTSDDASLLAIGLENGEIEVNKVAENYELNLLHRVQSHTVAIQDMKFSPYNDVLVSCAEQLCFWNVSYMLNNPLLSKTERRRSSRFSSQRSSDIDGVDADIGPANSSRNHLQVANSQEQTKTTLPETDNGDLTDALHMLQVWQQHTSPWLGKHGPADKPELLACIKFDGNSAEKVYTNATFTQFNTIDDAGVYYDLTLLQDDDNTMKSPLLTSTLRSRQQMACSAENLEFNYESHEETIGAGGDVVDWPSHKDYNMSCAT